MVGTGGAMPSLVEQEVEPSTEVETAMGRLGRAGLVRRKHARDIRLGLSALNESGVSPELFTLGVLEGRLSAGRILRHWRDAGKLGEREAESVRPIVEDLVDRVSPQFEAYRRNNKSFLRRLPLKYGAWRRKILRELKGHRVKAALRAAIDGNLAEYAAWRRVHRIGLRKVDVVAAARAFARSEEAKEIHFRLYTTGLER